MQAVPAIIKCLHDKDIDVCIDAAEALGSIRDKQAIPALLDSLQNDPDGDVKTMVTQSLGKIGGNEVEEALIKISQERPDDMDWSSGDDWDDWWDIQKEAVLALGNLGSEAAIPLLLEMLKNEYSQDIQVDLLKSLARIGGAADEELLGLLKLENFPAKLSNADKNLRRRIIMAMAESDSAATLKALGMALTDKHADVRSQAISSLQERGADSYVNPITLMLRDPIPEVKAAALKAINHLTKNQQDAEPFDNELLVQLLKQNDESLQLITINTILNLARQNCFVNSIEQLSESSQALLRACLTNKNITVISSAAQILGKIHDKHSLPFLIQLFNDQNAYPLVRQEVIRAISNFYENDAEARELLNTALFDKQQAVRLAVADSLLAVSNREKDKSIKEDDDDVLAPMQVLLATIKGEKIHLEDVELPEAGMETSEDSADTEKEQQAIDSIKEQFNEQDIPDSPNLIAENEDQAIRASMSTLEAIAMDNVEGAMAAKHDVKDKQPENEANPVANLIDPKDEELAPFMEVVNQNVRRAKKISRKKVDIDGDARYISVKLSAQNKQAKYNQDILETLNLALNDDDAQLRCESAKAIAVFSRNNPDLEAVAYSFGKLITLLHTDDDEMRLACIHALAQSHNRAALPALIEQFDAANYIVILHSIEAIQQIIVAHHALSEEQREFFMDNDEITNEEVISKIKPLLTHEQFNVRMAAVEALISLNTEEMIPVYIEVAMSGQAQLATKMAKVLKAYAPQEAIKVLLEKINSAPDSMHRRHLMEMLVILYQEQPGTTEALAA